MVAERITPEAVAAAQDVLDGEERRVLDGVAVTIGFTNATVKTGSPAEMEKLAARLFTLIERAPFKASADYQYDRMVLGALATELRGFAAAGGEPTGLEADLRAATSKAEEQRIRARIADQQAAYDRHIDDVLLAQAAQRAQHAPDTEEEHHEPAQDATPPTEPADVDLYL